MAIGKLRRTLPFLLGGVAVGVTLGVLFARKPGKETREDIKDWIKENRKKARSFYSDIRDTIPAKKHQIVAAFKAGKEALRGGNHRKELVHS